MLFSVFVVWLFVGLQMYDEHRVPKSVGDGVVLVIPDGGRKWKGENFVPATVHLDYTVGRRPEI